MADTYKVQDNGKAPSGLKAGDSVVTAGGTYKITGVNSDGSYKSEKVSNTTTSNYTGSYAAAPSSSSSSNGANTIKSAMSQAVAATTSNAAAKKNNTSSNPTSTSYSATAAQNAATTGAGTSTAGVTPGYTPTGTYNDAEVRATNADLTAQIDAAKARYATAQALYNEAVKNGDTTAANKYADDMRKAHADAELVRASQGYRGGDDGSEYITTPQNTAADDWSVQYGNTTNDPNYFDGVYLDPADQNLLSMQEMQLVISLKKEWANATPERRAEINQEVEKIRKRHGYSLGVDGKTYTSVPMEQDIIPDIGLSTVYEPAYEMIDNLQKASLDSNLNQLLSAYNNSRSEMEYQIGKLPAMYQQQRNAVSADNERQKMAFREQAAANGMNAGNRSQASLAFANQLQNNLGQLNTAEANALADATHDMTQLYTEYQSKIAQAYSDNNYQKMAQYLEEYSKAQQSAVENALAQAQLNLQVAEFNRQTRQNQLAQQNADKQYNLDLANLLLGYGDWTAAGNINGNTTKIAQYLASSNPEMYYILKQNGYL